MTKDDKVDRKYRSGQNVVFELGYCFGAFDSLDDRGKFMTERAVIPIVEEGVESFATLEGLQRIEFESGALDEQGPRRTDRGARIVHG